MSAGRTNCRDVPDAGYLAWAVEVPEQIKADSLWLVEAYRLGMYLSDLGWADATRLLTNPRTVRIADQLCRASEKISAAIAEGYSRDTGKARATFYEYAAGSARETRDWYFKARRVLDPQTVEDRIDLCTQIIRLTLTMISNERRRNRRASAAG